MTSNTTEINHRLNTLLKYAETGDWRVINNMVEHVRELIELLTPKAFNKQFRLYKKIVLAILDHDLNLNISHKLSKRNQLKRVQTLLDSDTSHCGTLALCICILHYIKEVWSLESEIENDLYKHYINIVRIKIIEKKYSCDWKSAWDVENEINLLVSSGYIDQHALSTILYCSELELLQTIAPLMGRDSGMSCNANDNLMVRLNDNEIVNFGNSRLTGQLDDVKDCLLKAIEVFNGDRKISTNAKSLLNNNFAYWMISDVECEVLATDLSRVLMNTTRRSGELCNTKCFRDKVIFLDNLLKHSNELQNKLILIIPASLLLANIVEQDVECSNSTKVKKMLDYCLKIITDSKSGTVHIPDIVYSILCMVSLANTTDIVDFDQFQTRFGKELIQEGLGIHNKPSLESIEYYDISADMLSEMTEGFKVCRDGSIEVVIKDKDISFVEEYSRNHRLLKLNEKNHDYEAMKYNLVYLVILIETLEKEVIYNKDIDPRSPISIDAQKAIRLAKSDLSIYMEKLKANDTSFNLNEFYRKVKAEKNTIKVDTISTINGIKTIIKSILL